MASGRSHQGNSARAADRMAEDRRRARDGAIALHRLDHDPRPPSGRSRCCCATVRRSIAVRDRVVRHGAGRVTFLLALIVDVLAPTFGGTKDFVASLKLVAYSYTAAWVAGSLPAARHARLPARAGRRDLLGLHCSFSARRCCSNARADKAVAVHDRRRAVRDRPRLPAQRAVRCFSHGHGRAMAVRGCGTTCASGHRVGRRRSATVSPPSTAWPRSVVRRRVRRSGAPSRTAARAASAAGCAGSARARSARAGRPRA